MLCDLDSVDAVQSAKNNDSYFYRIPLAVDTGYIYSTMVIADGKVIGYDTSMTYDTSLGQVTYLFDDDYVENLLEQVTAKVTDVTVLTIPSINTDFIYFSAGNKAYAIPFSSRPDFLGLYNGKIYEYDTFISCAKSLLSEMQKDISTDNCGKNGGNSFGVSNSKALYYIAFSATAVLILTVFCALCVKGKAHNSK